MTPYLIIFVLSSFIYFLFPKENKNENKISFLIVFFLVFCFSSLRGNLGGDIKRYQVKMDYIEFDMSNLLFSPEFFFDFYTWIIKYLFNDIFYFKFFSSVIFFFCLYIFLIKTKTYLLGLIISIPFGIILLHFGFLKQSFALSFILLFIISIQYNLFFSSIFFFLISIGFHFTSIIFLPVVFFLILKKIFKVDKYEILFYMIFYSILIIIVIFCLYFISITDFKNDKVFENYKIFSIMPEKIFNYLHIFLIDNYHYGNIIKSPGAPLRLIPYILAVILSFFIYQNKGYIFFNKNILYFFWFLFFFSLSFLIFGFSTVADRLFFYSIPFQIVTLVNFRNLFDENKIKILYDLLIIIFLFLVFLVWLTFSHFALANWQPFQFHDFFVMPRSIGEILER